MCRSPTRNLESPRGSGAGTVICLEQMMNQQPSLLPSPNHVTRMTVVQKACPWPYYGQRHSSRNPSGPCHHRLHHSLPVSHELQTALSPPTWLTWKKQPVLPFIHLFATTLRLCSQLHQLPHSENLWGGLELHT